MTTQTQDLELEIADAQIIWMNERVEGLVGALDSEENISDKNMLELLLKDVGFLLIQAMELKEQYRDSMNGTSQHYIDILDQYREKLEELRRSYS